MSGALRAWRDRVVEQLRQRGVNAVAAFDPARAPRWRTAAAAVSVRQAECAPGGFQDYLGTERGPDGAQREVYGRQAQLTLALDIFAPRDGGGDACLRAAEAAVEELVCRGAAGAAALEVRTDKIEFLERDGLYRQEVSCRCGVWLVARRDDETGTFTDFEVKGRAR